MKTYRRATIAAFLAISLLGSLNHAIGDTPAQGDDTEKWLRLVAEQRGLTLEDLLKEIRPKLEAAGISEEQLA